MKTEKDYEEFLELLNKRKVKYCAIGAFALAFHVRPRYTKDMDILIDPATDNARRLLIALDEFGFGSLNLAVKDFSTPGNIIQLGYEPVRIDIISSIKGLEFSDLALVDVDYGTAYHLSTEQTPDTATLINELGPDKTRIVAALNPPDAES